MNFRINRVCFHPEATAGVLIFNNWPVCVTLEDPWNDNQRNISCIPSGKYICKRYSSQNHPDTFEVTNVVNRDYVLFHVGNSPEDTEGCILLGTYFNPHKRFIHQSDKAFKKFLYLTAGMDEFELNIYHGVNHETSH